jgi:ABC-type antimicrobial peptide transport system permease subunit
MGLAALLMLMVAAREREIGIRLALGAARPSVVRSVVLEALPPLAIGAIAGVAMAALAGRLIASQLIDTGVLAADTVAIATGVLISTAMAAIVIPVRRAVSIDPARTLR